MKAFFTSLLPVILLIFLIPPSRAQVTVEWDKAIENNIHQESRTLLATPDGGLLMGGDAPDYWIMKLDAAGNMEWEKFYGGDSNEDLISAMATPDGGYLLGGISFSDASGDKTENSFGNFDVWIVKLDAAGNKEWDRTYGGTGFDGLGAMAVTSSGEYLIASQSYSGVSGNKTATAVGQDDYWVIKLDAEGNKRWDRTFGGTGSDQSTAIVSTPDDGFIVGGRSNSEVSGNKTAPSRGEYDYWIVRADAFGNQVWDRTFGGEGEDVLNTIIPAENNTWLLAGYSGPQAGGDRTEGSRGSDDFWVVKIDEAGSRLWDKTYGGLGVDRLVTAIPAHGGDYLLAGTSSSPPSGEKSEYDRGKGDYWIIKINESGTLLWDKTLGGTEREELFSLVRTPDGGYIAGGISHSWNSEDKIDDAPGEQDFWMIKFREGETPPPAGDIQISVEWDKTYKAIGIMTIAEHPDGSYLIGGTYANNGWIAKIGAGGIPDWEKSYGGSGSDGLNLIVPTEDGGFLLGGGSNSPVSGQKTAENKGEVDFWVVKTDAAGNKLWDRTYGGSSLDYLNTIVPTPDGGYLLGGQSYSNASGDKTEDSRAGRFISGDFWLVKIDAAGNKRWDRTFGGSEDDNLFSIVAAPDGGYLLAGYSYSDVSVDRSEPSFSPGNPDYWVVKIDEQGNKQWDKAYGGSSYDVIHAAVSTPDGGYLLGGYSASPVSGNRTAELKGEQDYWLVKTDASGNRLWDRSYGGSGWDQLHAMITTEEGYLLGGTSGSPPSEDKSENSRGGADYWVIQIDESGNRLWDKRVGASGGEYLRSLQETRDGFLLGGISTSHISGDKSENNTGFENGWLVKIIVKEPANVPEPTPGHVSGGGWFESPAGAISSSPAFRGKAYFALNARQKEGEAQPKGIAMLTIPQAQFRFRATEYEWMHVHEDLALMKGSGQLNGEEGFSFLISVMDYGPGVLQTDDTFRMIIWDSQENIVYDNQRGSDTYAQAEMAIGGGNVLIHRAMQRPDMAEMKKNMERFRAYPVPLAGDGLWLEFPETEDQGEWQLSILDFNGKKVAERNFSQSEGRKAVHWKLNHLNWPAGIYHIVIRRDGQIYNRKIVK